MKFLTILFVLWWIRGFVAKKNVYGYTVQSIAPIRGILAVVITAVHLIQFENIRNPWLISETRQLATPCVAVFFFVSGYGLIKSLKMKGNAYFDSFISKRLLRILIPLIIVCVIYNLLQYLCFKGYSIDLSFHSWNVNFPFLPTGWFCVTIILYYLFFYCFSYISKTPRIITLGLIVFSFFYIIVMHHYNFYDYWYVSSFILSIGALVASYEDLFSNVFQIKYLRRIWIFLLIAA